MANSATGDTGDLTKCSICLEEFKTPKYLPCLHTFCESCLNSYITSAFKSTSSIGSTKPRTLEFNCPICRSLVTAPDPKTSHDEWARQFPQNHLIVTLIDQNKLKAKVKLCDPCQSDNEESKAVNWCSDCSEALCSSCAKSHRRMKISKGHVIQDIAKMGAVPVITTTGYCENHREKKLDTYCVDHEEPCCTTCIAVNHRKCDHVTTLEDAAKGVLETDQLSTLSEELTLSSTEISKTVKEKKENVDCLEKQKCEIKKELEKLRININKHLDELESASMKEISCIHNEEITTLTDMIKDLENRQKILENYRDVIKTCKSQASDVHVFLEMKQIERGHKEQVTVLQPILSNHETVEYKFELNKCAEDIISTLKSFGTLSVEHPANGKETNQTFLKPTSPFLKDCKPKLISSFSNARGSYIFGGKFVSDKTLLLTVYGQKKLVKCNEAGNEVTELKLNGYLYDITMIDNNTTAITRTDNAFIDFIDIKTFTVSRNVSTTEHCWGIYYDDNKLYVGCQNKLLVMNANGELLNEIQTKDGMKCVTVVKSGKNKIVYGTFETNSCHFIRASDMKEIHTFKHTDLGGIRGLTSDRDGNVYITGQTSGNVFQISSEGQFMQIILSDINQPCAIEFDGDTNRFFISYGSNPANINIYEMITP